MRWHRRTHRDGQPLSGLRFVDELELDDDALHLLVEMSILNESSIALPYVAASAVARSGAAIVETGERGAATRVVRKRAGRRREISSRRKSRSRSSRETRRRVRCFQKTTTSGFHSSAAQGRGATMSGRPGTASGARGGGRPTATPLNPFGLDGGGRASGADARDPLADSLARAESLLGRYAGDGGGTARPGTARPGTARSRHGAPRHGAPRHGAP